MIKKFLKTVLILLLLGFVIVSSPLVYYYIKYHKGYENIKKFESLEPGITLNEAQDVLGKPIKIEFSRDRKYEIHYYETPPIMSDSLRLTVRLKDKIVEEIWISERVKYRKGYEKEKLQWGVGLRP
ncbi:MAG: hypothetical protein AB1414_08865 [bacterium]